MNEKTKNELRGALQAELSKLEGELKSVGRINPDNPKDWQPTPAVMDALPSDTNEVADTIEEFEDNTAILKELEIQYNEVKKALDKINHDGYGICKVCKEEISLERLKANPSAETCVKHMN